jgi:hypothetical protein
MPVGVRGILLVQRGGSRPLEYFHKGIRGMGQADGGGGTGCGTLRGGAFVDSRTSRGWFSGGLSTGGAAQGDL